MPDQPPKQTLTIPEVARLLGVGRNTLYDAVNRGEIPVLRMLRLAGEEIGRRAEAMKDVLTRAGLACDVVPESSAVGGGAFPSAELPTRVLVIAPPVPAADMEQKLRAAAPPVIVRIQHEQLIVDLRTVNPESDGILAEALLYAARP